MSWITIATPSFSTLDEVDAVLAQLDGPPEGMEARYIGATENGELRVISHWESKGHAERFFVEKLGPAVAKAHGPEPQGAAELTGIEVARTYVRQPVG